MTTAKEVESLEFASKKLLDENKTRHVAVINKLGKFVAGASKKGVEKYLDDEKVKMVYMQLMLDLRMRQELDEILGPVDYIIARRKKITIISVPTENYLIVISTERDADSEKIVSTAEKLFDIIDFKKHNN